MTPTLANPMQSSPNGGDVRSCCSIINALAVILPDQVTPDSECDVIGVLVDAFPGDARALVSGQCKRHEVDVMLGAVQRWSAGQGWPAWSFRPMHPVPPETAQETISALRAELEVPRTVALCGFAIGPRYICVVQVTNQVVLLRNNGGERRIGLREIETDARWSLEHCWVFRRCD